MQIVHFGEFGDDENETNSILDILRKADLKLFNPKHDPIYGSINAKWKIKNQKVNIDESQYTISINQDTTIDDFINELNKLLKKSNGYNTTNKTRLSFFHNNKSFTSTEFEKSTLGRILDLHPKEISEYPISIKGTWTDKSLILKPKKGITGSELIEIDINSKNTETVNTLLTAINNKINKLNYKPITTLYKDDQLAKSINDNNMTTIRTNIRTKENNILYWSGEWQTTGRFTHFVKDSDKTVMIELDKTIIVEHDTDLFEKLGNDKAIQNAGIENVHSFNMVKLTTTSTFFWLGPSTTKANPADIFDKTVNKSNYNEFHNILRINATKLKDYQLLLDDKWKRTLSLKVDSDKTLKDITIDSVLFHLSSSNN
jgi:hypothetical protein